MSSVGNHNVFGDRDFLDLYSLLNSSESLGLRERDSFLRSDVALILDIANCVLVSA